MLNIKIDVKNLKIFKIQIKDKMSEQGQQGGSQPSTKQASYNKNEKTKDVRTTNIQAAKGWFLHK